MHESFTGLLGGLVLAVALVYLLMVVNFQSWLDPLVIVGGLPASLAGIAWILFVTRTTLSVPALTGTILHRHRDREQHPRREHGRELLAGGAPPWQAALDAGFSRFRPVLMTALAMLIGMLPMALGLGDGGEQNAPLGRAVIGASRSARCRRCCSCRSCSASSTHGSTGVARPHGARSAPPIRRRWADRAAALPSDSSNLGFIMNDSIEPRPAGRRRGPPCRKHDRTRGRPPAPARRRPTRRTADAPAG